MSEEKMVIGYDVTVRGTYYSASGKDRILANFGPVTFFMPEIVEIPNGKKKVETTVEGTKRVTFVPQTKKSSVAVDGVALWVVQRRLLPTWLAENHPTSVGFRTCQITPGGMKRIQRPASQVVNLEKPVSEMSMQELAAFCKLKNLNTPVSAFKDVAEARLAVAAELDPSISIMAPETTMAAAAPPAGVTVAEGPVSSGDGVPTDQEEEGADLLK